MFSIPLLPSDAFFSIKLDKASEKENKETAETKENNKTNTTNHPKQEESPRVVEQLSPNCTMEVTEDTIHITVVSESMEGVEVQPYGPGEGPNAESVVSEEIAPQPVQDLAATLQAAAAANPNSPLAVGIEAGNQRRNQPKGGGNRHRGHRISG